MRERERDKQVDRRALVVNFPPVLVKYFQGKLLDWKIPKY